MFTKPPNVVMIYMKVKQNTSLVGKCSGKQVISHRQTKKKNKITE